MAGIAKNRQKYLFFHCAPSQLRIADGSGFAKKRIIITIRTVVIMII